jgi:hypothetical protein
MEKFFVDVSRSNIIDFNRNFLDPETPLSCIGGGELGGKAHGLASIRTALREVIAPAEFRGIKVDVPAMTVLCTDVFDAFMAHNNLYEIALSDLSDDRIAHAFQRAELPFEILGDLRTIVEQVHIPLAIRSSSMLEDALRAPFAGVYATKMIPNSAYDPDVRFRQLADAIKYVFASMYFRTAKDYCKATGYRITDEKMSVIVQEMVGKRYHEHFYPELSGVARSYNYYPVQPARPEDGVVNLALGLGKTIMDGGVSWAYSPAYPDIDPPFGSVEELLDKSQTEFWVVNMGELPEYHPLTETEYMQLENLTAAERDETLHYLASTYSPLTGRLSIGTGFPGPRALTFAPLLILKQIPLNDLLIHLLKSCEKTAQAPVEIEFAMTFDPPRFCFLQIRPMAVPGGESQVSMEELRGENILVASESVLGNGNLETIKDIIYLKPDSFDLKHTKAIVPELEHFNDQLLVGNRPYLLIVFGRLGTTDPWLGLPTTWGQVCGAKVIVEATRENARIELSQGSHYFHNVINLGIKYFSLPFASPYQINWDWLEKQTVVEETAFIRHIQLAHPLQIKVDGRNSRGVIRTPDEDSK